MTLSGKTKLIFSKIQGRNDDYQLSVSASQRDHHTGTFDGDGPFGKYWQCCQEYDAFSVGCQQGEETSHHPKNYQEARAFNGVNCCVTCCLDLILTTACFPCCFVFGITMCGAYAFNPLVRESMNKDLREKDLRESVPCLPEVPRSAKWLCCGNPDRSAKGCRAGLHPEQIVFYESFLPAGLLNRDQGSLSCSVSMNS